MSISCVHVFFVQYHQMVKKSKIFTNLMKWRHLLNVITTKRPYQPKHSPSLHIPLQIWNTVKKAGKRSATMFWPGSDVKIQGKPSFCLILLAHSRVLVTVWYWCQPSNVIIIILAGLPGFARDSCSKIISITAFYF